MHNSAEVPSWFRRRARRRLVALVASLATIALPPTDVAAQEHVGIQGVHDLTEVAEGVYAARPRFGSATATIVLMGEFVVLVDPHSTPAGARALLSEVRALTDRPIRYVVNTHWHGDHHGGNRAIAEALDGRVSIIAHPETRAGIEGAATDELRASASFRAGYVERATAYLEAGVDPAGAPLSERQRAQVEAYAEDMRRFIEAIPTYEYLLPDLLVGEELTLRGSDRSLVVRFVGRPAHTRGDLVVWLPEDRVLIGGDLLTVPYVVPRSGFPRSYAAALDDLAAYDFRYLVPGHGGRLVEDTELLGTMSAFLVAASDYAYRSSEAGRAEAEIVERAPASAELAPFEARIEWDAPGGLTFLDFDSLARMTVARALVERREAASRGR